MAPGKSERRPNRPTTDRPTTRIDVEAEAEGQFRVRVTEGNGESTHKVTVSTLDYDRIVGGKLTRQELVKRSFEFLLEREPKESILAQFDLSVIGRYFPDYEGEIKRGL